MTMKQQLIINVLGADQVGILNALANAVCKAGCNILDSRQAIYGQDFSLTMILEGSSSAITKAEQQVPIICQQLDLLSLMKRTKQHCKQDLVHLADVEFVGLDAVGLIRHITTFFAHHNITINAFRQNTFVEQSSKADMVKCKMVVSMPDDTELATISSLFEHLLDDLNLIGNITEKH